MATHFNPIYWDTACLVVNSGAIGGGSTDYAKSAKALGEIMSKGIKVSLPNINTSALTFRPDVKNNQILFGLKSMLNVGDDVLESTIANRPYTSITDYINKVNPNKQAMVSLIKGGAFDEFGDRRKIMETYLWDTCDKKKRITLQNLPGLIKMGMLPEDTEERVNARRVYEFNRYLKKVCADKDDKSMYALTDRAINFLIDIDQEELIESDGRHMSVKKWAKVYNSWMDVFRKWIAQSKDEILNELNHEIFQLDWNKYAQGTISAWEMEALCFYYHEHELSHVNMRKYGFVDFSRLPTEPVVDTTYTTRAGHTINLFKLSKICGTCIAKNKVHSSVTLLTTSGVIEVKFRKEYFALFDKQISVRGDDGVKHVIEKSWFNRGGMIVVQGIRQGDTFIAKKYNNSQGHQLYRITDIDAHGNIELQTERARGDIEDSDEHRRRKN